MCDELDNILSKCVWVEDCLVWTRCINSDGYPRAGAKGNSNIKLHRKVFELYNNVGLDRLLVRHTCDNRLCLNPKHLISGSNIENVKDRVLRDRSRGLKINEVLEIKKLYKNKIFNYKELALMYKVSIRTIHYTINRKVGT